jgi:type VI secretion system secreted protein Hcp
MFKEMCAALVAASLLLRATSAEAALMAYLRVKGQKSGQIKGGITQKGREDTIGVISYEHEVRMGDEAKRVGSHASVLKVTTELDRSVPLLYNAMVTSEVLSEVVLQFWTPQIRAGSGVGSEVQHFTIRLTNARIVSIRQEMANVKNPDLQKYDIFETVSFAYDKIEWTWNDGGITATDNWQSR